MGKREEQDSRKVLAGEKINIKTRFSLINLLLWPLRAYQQKRREAAFRKHLFKF